MRDTQQDAWRVLLVDDDEEDYLLTRSMLGNARRQAAILEWAPSYEAGQQMLRLKSYHAVLVDYDLGARTGIELIREAVAGGYPSPLILYSGRATSEADVEAMEAGATLYLAKNEASPFLLERSLRYAIERKRMEQELAAHRQKLAASRDEMDAINEKLRAANEELRLQTGDLAAAKESLEGVLDAITDGYYALDPDWKFTAANRAAEEHFGTPLAGLLGKNIWELTGTPANSPIYRRFLEARIGGQPVHFEAGSKIRSGYWAEMHVYPRRGSLEVYFADISVRKQAEDRIRRQNALLAGINRIFREAITCQSEEDNGIGFDMRLVNQLFQPFHRLNEKSEYEGAGMGLAICRKIAERHGGGISAQAAPGEGATFRVRLPREQG